MEDYIYIIIGIIWLVFTVIKNNQKKAQQQQDVGQKPASSVPPIAEAKTFEDILTEILNPVAPVPSPQMMTEPEEYYTEETISPEIVLEEARTEYQSLEEIFAAEAEERLASRSVAEMPEDSSKSILSEEKHDVLNRIDLRKAVIYQAILERPYA